MLIDSNPKTKLLRCSSSTTYLIPISGMHLIMTG